MNKINSKSILVVDDEPDVLMLTQKTLELAGYDVTVACDGKEGLEIARKNPPDLIILDLLLPGMDGYKVCGILKHDVQYMMIPILILSGRSRPKDYEMGIKIGANAYLTKPIESNALLNKVAELIKLSPRHLSVSDEARKT